MRLFLGCFCLFGALVGAYLVTDMDSQEVDEIGWSGKLGLDEYSGLPQHDLSYFSKRIGKMCLFLEFFWLFLGFGRDPGAYSLSAFPI